MRWTPGSDSSDVEDRRNDGGGGGGGFGGGGGMRLGIGGFLILGVLSLIFRRDLITPFIGGGEPTTQSAPDPARDAAEENGKQFVTFALNDMQKTWEQIFAKGGDQYRRTKLVLFRDGVDSACGPAQSAMGPFYCPGDEKVYIDLAFYDELKNRFGAAGDFAQAYVIAHEVGHHVQKLLNVEAQVRRIQQQRPDMQNQLSVRMELQADCFAGLWGKSTAERNLLEQGDVEEAINAASAVGDDHIQKMSGRRVNTESFTHGSSKDRMAWYQRGFQSGTVDSCNTFANQ